MVLKKEGKLIPERVVVSLFREDKLDTEYQVGKLAMFVKETSFLVYVTTFCSSPFISFLGVFTPPSTLISLVYKSICTIEHVQGIKSTVLLVASGNRDFLCFGWCQRSQW